MKIQKNKLASAITLLTVLLITSTSSAVQSIQNNIITSGSWSAAEVAGHDLWNKSACVAATKSTTSASTLEVYAEKSEIQNLYIEPTLQIVLRGENAKIVRGILTTDKVKQEIHLTLASHLNTTTNSLQNGLLVRLDQRKLVSDTLQKSGTISVKLIDDFNKTIKTLTFSMNGSQKVIGEALKTCGLSLDF